MTSINTTSLQQFSSLFQRSSSNSISDEYKKNLYLARIAREDKRESTQNYVENAAETTQEEQTVSNISDEVTISSQSTESSAPKTSANTTATQTKNNSSEKNQTYDNTINQLKTQKNSLQQKLNRLNQKGNNQSASPNQKGERETAQDVDEPIPSANGPMTEEAAKANVLKRQINDIKQEINKVRNETGLEEDDNSTSGLSLSQIRQKKTILEQQLRSLENKTPRPRSVAQDTNRTTTTETAEEEDNPQYQNDLEELKIKQEIRNLNSKINNLERKEIIQKSQAALNAIKNISNGSSNTENHLVDIEA